MSDNVAQATLNAGQNLALPRILAGHKPYAVVPEGAVLTLLEPEAAQPARVKASHTFHDAPSLIGYVNRFKNADSALFADIDSTCVRAIIDHHSPDNGPEYCEHRLVFAARPSEEWKVWTSHSGRSMNQEAFAGFIEDNAFDVLKPSGADLLEIALSIEASKSGSFKSARRLQNGSVQFNFSEETTGRAGGGQLEIPKEFSVQVRPFIGCVPHELIARLRYRIDGGSLALWYDLLRADVLRREAFDAIIKRIADETSLPVMMGVPSA